MSDDMTAEEWSERWRMEHVSLVSARKENERLEAENESLRDGLHEAREIVAKFVSTFQQRFQPMGIEDEFEQLKAVIRRIQSDRAPAM